MYVHMYVARIEPSWLTLS